MKEVRIGKWQPLGGVRLKSWAIYSILLLLGLGNAVAGVAEWHGCVGMMVFNGVCVAALIVAVIHKVLQMEPRKMWRVLAFLLTALGVLAVFCSEFLAADIEPWLKTLLLVAGSVLLLMGGISMVRWRRYSFERKEQLQNDRPKKRK